MVIALYNTLHHHYSLFLFIYITFITWKMDNVSHVKDFRFFCSNNISSVTLRIILKLRGGLYLTKSKQIFQVQQLDPFAMKVLGTYLFSTFLTVFSIIIVWTRTCMIVSVSSLSDLIIIVQRFLKWQVCLQQRLLHFMQGCYQHAPCMRWSTRSNRKFFRALTSWQSWSRISLTSGERNG